MEVEIQAVLFDMGGVLVQLDSAENMFGPSALPIDEIWRRWIMSDAVQAFERGRSTVEDFASALVNELDLEATAAEFLDRFTRLPQGLYPGAEALVASVPDGITTAVLSNTSAHHWEHQIDNEIIRNMCEREYLSYQVGLAKPHREIYDYAVADLSLDPAQVLFIDDNQVNVDGARDAGLRAGLAKGPEQASAVLRDHGVVNR